MELEEAIEKRISIRKFKNEKVEDGHITKILNAAILAPSAKNRQPWNFYIAKGEIKSKIVEIMKNWNSQNTDNTTSVLATAIAIDEAPVLILVFRKSSSQFERSDTLSIGGMIEHILLKATELGLGSLWIADTWYVREEISKLVGTDLELYSAISIGYADENPKKRPRKNLSELLLN